jgi:peroxiredoxin
MLFRIVYSAAKVVIFPEITKKKPVKFVGFSEKGYLCNSKRLSTDCNMKRLLILLISFVCMLTVQAQLPKVTLKDINGKAVSTDTLSNGGRPFIIDFFATWCKPCNRELDAISEVYEEWQQETGVKIIAVSIDQAQNINKVKPLVDNHGWDYEVLLDPNSDLKRAFGIQMIPYVLIVDGQGNIVYKHQGYTDGAEVELIEKVREVGR